MHWIQRQISLMLFFLVLVVGFGLSPSIGPAWDDPDNIFSGGVYVNFIQHGFDSAYFHNLTDKASAYGDWIVPNDRLTARYPPVPNYVGVLFVLVAQVLHIPVTAQVIIVAWHLAAVFFFAMLVSMTFRFGLLLGLSAVSSLFASLAVFMYPQLFGHGFSNLKDTAQAALMITSLYYLVRATKDNAVKRIDFIIGAVIFGLGLATKFNAIYVPVIWGIWRLVMSRNSIVRTVFYGFCIVVIGLVTMFAVWPFLWFDLVPHIIEVVKYFTTVGQGYRIVWDGIWNNVGVGKSLWWYPGMSYLYTTPLLLLCLVGWGCIVVCRQHAQKPSWVILPIWILIPLVRTLSPWSAFYDLTRHFMEIIPATLLMAAIGLEWFFRKKRHFVALGIMLVAVIIGQMISINATYFPYSTGYYNVLARNPNVNFDRDILALSVKETMDYVHRRYGNVRIFFTIGGHLSRYYLTQEDRYINADQGQGDIIIVVNKASHFQIADFVAKFLGGYTMIHDIHRGDAVFAWIYKRNE